MMGGFDGNDKTALGIGLSANGGTERENGSRTQRPDDPLIERIADLHESKLPYHSESSASAKRQ